MNPYHHLRVHRGLPGVALKTLDFLSVKREVNENVAARKEIIDGSKLVGKSLSLSLLITLLLLERNCNAPYHADDQVGVLFRETRGFSTPGCDRTYRPFPVAFIFRK
jgi:hypothetical protein